MSESRANGDWPLEDIAGFVLEEARRSGATAADVVIAEGDALSTAVRLGEVEKLQRARGKHLGLRVFVDQRSAVTSSADFSRDALKNLASETCALARLVEADECGGLPEPADLAGVVPDLDLFHPKEVSAEDGLELARRAEAAALGVDPRITNSEGAEFSCDTRHAVYASTLGFTGGYRSSTFGLSAVPVATDNGQMQRDYWYSAKRVFSELEDPEEIGRRAAQRTLRRIGGRKISTQQVPVIFEAEVASSLLRHLAGAVSGYALYKGASFLTEKLGEQIAPSFVTIIDDGTIARGLGSSPFDGEGVSTRRTVLVDRGVLRSYLFDSYSARKMKARTTGNASRSISDAPHVGSHNFYLEPGEAASEEIIRSVKRGLYVTELIGHGVNPVTGDYSRGAVGSWIEDGELAYPVEEITIAGNLLQMYRDIEMIGSELNFRSSTASPLVKIAQMTVAGA